MRNVGAVFTAVGASNRPAAEAAGTRHAAYRRDMAIQILDVGQCGFDGPRMMRLFQERLGATVTNAADAEAALAKLREDEFDIVLVNRVFAADEGDGIALIRELRNAGLKTPVMLVSDLPEAQDQAVAAGAVRGFGKSKLGDPATLELIKNTAHR